MNSFLKLLAVSLAVPIAVAVFYAAAAPCFAAPSPAASYPDCIKSYNELKAAIDAGAGEKTIERLAAAYKEKLAAYESLLAEKEKKEKETPAEAFSQPVPPAGEDEACAQAGISKTMCELETITRELRYNYSPAKAEKIITRLNEIIKANPAGSPEAERAAFELAGVHIKKKDYSGALKVLDTLKNLKSNAVNDSDVKNLSEYAAAMNNKKIAAAARTANTGAAQDETGRAPARIDESSAASEGPECATTAANAPVRFDPAGFEGISRYKPIAEWTGRLILPSPAQREPDGSVFIEVHNSPDASLTGKIIRLRWDLSRPEDAWFEMIRTTVSFDPKRLESERVNALILPMRLAGWPAVSALESLAGARPQDDVDVILKEPVYTGGSLYVNQEPVQICGSHFGLVRFEGPAEGGSRRVRHYNPASGSFDGASETIAIAPKCELTHLKRLVTTTVDIEKSPLNDDGWYIYGTPSGAGFAVKALEPRRALALAPSKTVGGKREVKYYFSREHFSGLEPSTARSSLIATDAGEWTAAGGDERAYCDRYWPVGKKGIVVHLFGWHETAGEKKKIFSLPLVTGHFAFGIAEVVADPFTGEKRFDIEYKQVYAHNNTGIISGSIKWHNYMGDLKRGWMYSIPVSDTIIQVPELEPYDINGWRINPARGFSRMAEIMMAVYRTGGGSGISSVRPDVSCVQDSHYVLYGALMTFEKNIKNSRNIFEWLRGKDPMDKNVMRFFGLDTLVSQLKDRVTILGLARGDWKNNFENPIGTRNPNAAEKTIRTLLSLKTVFPRDGNDNLIFFAANRNYRMWSVLTAMCGGRVDGLKPLAPNSIIRR